MILPSTVGLHLQNLPPVTAENVRASREKSGNQQLANLPTCYYKYVYVILCIQSCPILRGINSLSSTFGDPADQHHHLHGADSTPPLRVKPIKGVIKYFCGSSSSSSSSPSHPLPVVSPVIAVLGSPAASSAPPVPPTLAQASPAALSASSTAPPVPPTLAQASPAAVSASSSAPSVPSTLAQASPAALSASSSAPPVPPTLAQALCLLH